MKILYYPDIYIKDYKPELNNSFIDIKFIEQIIQKQKEDPDLIINLGDQTLEVTRFSN